MADIFDKAKAVEDYVIDFRRDLHMHPELSGVEFRTQQRIMEELDKLGIPYRKVGNTSLVATLNEGKGKVVALRGDTDALPVLEQADVEFKSTIEGNSHACGHDAHAAMLLGAARVLSEMKDEIDGEVRFFFQEGEETFTGAKLIVEEGGMDGVDVVFGMHGMTFFGDKYLTTGTYDITPGYRMSGCDTIYVKFEGTSAHGSAPNLGRDAVHAAANFVVGLNDVVTKSVDPQQACVLNVGRFVGGTKANIVAKYAEMDISMRYFDAEAREALHEGIRRLAKSFELRYEMKIDVDIEESALSLYNDEAISELARGSAEKIFGPDKYIEFKRSMGSEDMPYYFQKAPGCYAFLGIYNEDIEAVYFPHHERYKADEAAFKYGTALHVQFVLDYLAQANA